MQNIIKLCDYKQQTTFCAQLTSFCTISTANPTSNA